MKKGNLLIIDDEELLVNSMKFIMKDLAEEVFTAHNGEEGLKIIQSESIQCVICDIAMPKMTGVELIKKVRELGSEVPFIFYTAYDHSELMMEAAKYGAYDFLRKPNMDNLQEILTAGIKAGFERQMKTSSDDSIMNEYDKILNEFQKQHK